MLLLLGWAEENNIENIKLQIVTHHTGASYLMCNQSDLFCPQKPQVTQSAEEAVSEYSISSSDDASSE